MKLTAAAVALLLLLLLAGGSRSHEQADPSNFLVFGPGLDARKQLPVRYVFVQVRNTVGEFVDDRQPPPEQHDPSLRLQLSSEGRPVRFRSDALKLNHNGLYVLRYRLYETVSDASLSILYYGMHVASSPYRLAGQVRDDSCSCPEFSLEDWLLYHGCQTNYTQIDRDFSRFTDIHMPIVLKEAYSRYNNPGAYAYCHYVIKDNALYRKCFGQHTGFTFMSDPMLLGLLRKMRVPDMEFLLNLGDWPLAQLKRQPHLPILSWCGSEDTADIVLPTYEIAEATHNMMDRVYNDVFRTMHDSLRYAWDAKIERGFFRGRDSSKRRLELVRKSVKQPELIDARLTNMFFFEKSPDLGQLAKHVPMSEFFQFKYQINMDGTVAAYRLPFLLAGGSTVLKQQSQYYEHFYADLSEGQHYVAVSEDLGNLEERILWLRNRDSMAREIAELAREFVLEHLQPESVLCYQASVLNRYASLLRSNVRKPSKEFEFVPQPSDSNCKCSFHHQAKAEL